MEFIWDLISSNLDVIISFILGLGIVAPFLVKPKKAIKELSELLNALHNGLADNKLSKEEIASVVKEAKDVLDLFKKKE